jgi:thiosulfate reductase cytochrome b subunit
VGRGLLLEPWETISGLDGWSFLSAYVCSCCWLSWFTISFFTASCHWLWPWFNSDLCSWGKSPAIGGQIMQEPCKYRVLD